MQLTITAVEEGGGTDLSGIGTKAVIGQNAAGLGGGYIVNVLDGKGGFGLSVLSPTATQDQVIALAKVLESHR